MALLPIDQGWTLRRKRISRPPDLQGLASRRGGQYSRTRHLPCEIAPLDEPPESIMAKRAAAEPKPAAAPPAEDRFVELMLLAADFAKSCGGLAEAKKALSDAGQFIHRAGNVSNAEKALDVLESLREKIG